MKTAGKFIRRAALALAISAAASNLWADDIDLYTGGRAQTGAASNVLIFLDNSANWSNASGWTSTQGEAELNALKTVLDTLPSSVNVGIMMHTQTGSAADSYVRFAMRPMTDANRTRLKELFDDIISTAPNAPQDKVAQSADGDRAIEEIYRYFNGLSIPSGTARDAKEDYSSNTDYYSTGGSVSANLAAKSHPATIGALGNYAYSSSGATQYNKPSEVGDGCAKNFVIWIGNTSLDGSTTTTRLTTAASDAGISSLSSAYTSQITTYSASNSAPQGVMLDEWARFMNKYGVETTIDDPQNTSTKLRNSIITYTVDVFPPGASTPNTCIGDTSGGAQQIQQHYLMQSTANAGGGKCYPATNTQQLTNALQAIFAEIQAVNSVFASATLPISVNTQGTYENQVYIGVFRPDAFSRPRWWGNLKQYQFARYCDANLDDLVTDVGGPNDERIDRETGNTGTAPTCTGATLKLFLADRNNKPAIDQSLTTGFISLSATSLWTQDSNFWSFSPLATTNNSGASDAPDGPNVERGGAAYRERVTMPVKTAGSGTADLDHRNVFTCMGTCLAAGATDAQRQLGANTYSVFKTTNTLITDGSTGRFDNAWPKSISVSRTAGLPALVTVSAGGLSFTGGESVIISGTGNTAYDTTKTVLNTGSGAPADPTATTFYIDVTETPADDTSGNARVSDAAGSTTATISGITYNAATNTATVTTSAAHGFSSTNTITIAGATQAAFNGSFTITVPGGSTTTFTYTPNFTAPATPATTAGSATINTPVDVSQTNAALRRLDTATNPVRVTGTWGDTVPDIGNPKLTVGTTTVTVSGATSATYNGTFTIVGTQGSCSTSIIATGPSKDANLAKFYCYDLLKGESGAGMTATKAGGGAPVAVTFTRSGTTVTGATAAGIAGSPTSVTVTDSPVAGYNGTKTISWSGNNFTFTTTVSPATTTVTGQVTISGAATVTASNLVEWMRGVDVLEDENANNSKVDVRASIHGDVLHSRPLLINYGGTIGIVGFYSANDGYLRAIKGGSTDSDGIEKWAFVPDEFVSYSKLSRLYSNSSLIRFPNSTCTVTPSPQARDYFWDGQLSVYQSTSTVKYPHTIDGPYTRPAQTILYAGMRRGGRSIYAIDVSDPDTPYFLWKIDNTMTNFSQLGYTWSEPKVAKIKGKTSGGADDIRDVLIFGAGYDPTDDDQASGCPRGDHSASLAEASAGDCTNNTGSYTGIGRGIFIVDALTGAFINLLAPPTAANKYSFPADVTLFDGNGDGYVDRIYAGDSGAQLFRFDINSAKQLAITDTSDTNYAYKKYYLGNFGDMSSSTTTPTAYASADKTRNGGTDARKFLFPPTVLPFVYTKMDGTKAPAATMVIVGSGDREKPLANYSSSNTLNTLSSTACNLYPSNAYFGSRIRDRVFGFVDRNADLADPTGVATAADGDLFAINTSTVSTNATDTTLSSYSICTAFETNCTGVNNTATNKGWFLNLKNSVNADTFRDEEKLVSAPQVISGTVFFGTNTPQEASASAGVCSNLGQARSYAVNPFTGLAAFDRDGNGSLTSYSDLSARVTGGGLPPTVTGGVVKIGEGFYRFLIGAGGTGTVSASPIAGAKNPITVTGPRSRLYWSYGAD